MSKELTKLEGILDVLSVSKSLDEVVGLFEEVVKIASDIQVSTERELAALERFRDKAEARVKTKLAAVKDGKRGPKGDRGADGRNGADGKNANPADVVPLVLEALPKTEPEPLSGNAIIAAINDNDTDTKIAQERIEGLKQALATRVVSGGGGGASGGNVVRLHDLSSSLNGSSSTFSLPAFWRIVSVHLSGFPYSALRPTTDYTVDAAAYTITFTSQIDAATQLASGQTLLIVYATTV